MKQSFFPYITLGLGGLGLALRIWLYSGRDASGLLPVFHISEILLLFLTLGALVLFYLKGRQYANCRLQASVPAAAGCWAAAAGTLYLVVSQLRSGGRSIADLICIALEITAAVCFLLLGRKHLKKETPDFLLHCLITVFFLVYTVLQSRHWRSEPQLQQYGCQVLASVFLMLSAYHQTAMTLGPGNMKAVIFSSQTALLFCCFSLNTESAPYYLAMAGWIGSSLCGIREAE